MKLRTRSFQKTVTTAGTQERLTDLDLQVPYIRIQPLDANTNPVFIGDAEVSSANGIELLMDVVSATGGGARGLSILELHGTDKEGISLNDIWVDVTTSTEGVSVLFLERVST